MRWRTALAILALLAAPAAAQAPERPVRVGLAGADLDACLSDGVVANLDPRGDNFLAVRAAPSTRARMLARLGPHHPVQVCEQAPGGWLGIVYGPDPADRADCGTGSPVARPQPYRGPCRSGWVSARYITIVAG